MSKYIGTMIVNAEPAKLINRCGCPVVMPVPKEKGIYIIAEGDCHEMPTVKDVYVYDSGSGYVDDDGKLNWMLKEDFEKKFRLAEDMSFGQAIEAAKQGKQIARRGWNGKGQYVELASCIAYIDPYGYKVNADHAAAGNRAFAFVGTSGVQLGWLASQADMLAEDWYIVELAPSDCGNE